MADQTRREFLVAAGGVLASTGLVASEPKREKTDSDNKVAPESTLIPPHRANVIEGVHAYTDRVNVQAGESVRFHVSSSHPYELEVCRLGVDVDSPSRDDVLHQFGRMPALVQPIHPGSYLAVDTPLDAQTALPALAIEIWVRRWRTIGLQTIISQFNEPDACGFAIFVNQDGSVGFYLGNGGAFSESFLHTSGPNLLKMQVNPEGLKSYPDNTPSSVLSNEWHHIVAQCDGRSKQLWVDGNQIGNWEYKDVIRPGSAPLRIGSAGRNGRADYLLDADLAMPVLYRRFLSPTEIAARFATKGLELPTGSDILACWPLSEERGERVADISTNGRHARIINLGTWMIGGPSFNASVPRFGDYDPAMDALRGHGLRLASDDLYDCRWNVSQEFRLPETARSGMYVGRIRFNLDGEERLYHTVFIVNKAASKAQSAGCIHLLDKQLESLFGDLIQPDLEGAQKIDR